MNTPDTETDEALEDLLDAICNTRVYDDWNAMREAAAPILAAIRRHAAAQALTQQADRLSKLRAIYLKQAAIYVPGSEARSATHVRSREVSYVASLLRQAARDVIAEGYEHTCGASWSATRTDPGYGCDNPVPNEGDLCERHDTGDEDRWAE